MQQESHTIKEAKNKGLFDHSQSNIITPAPLDFDKMLYNNVFESPFAYEKYMGRIKLKESNDLQVKSLIPEGHQGESVFAQDFVRHYLDDVAKTSEVYFQTNKDIILGTLRDHLRETKRVYELYDQFKPIIAGDMQARVMDFVHQ